MSIDTIAVDANHDIEFDNTALLLTANKLAEVLSVSVRTLWRLRAAGKLPRPIRLGGSLRWRAEDIQAWIDAGCPAVLD